MLMPLSSVPMPATCPLSFRNLEHLYSPDPGTAAPDQVAAMWQALDVFFE
jgi:hypothetical protein